MKKMLLIIFTCLFTFNFCFSQDTIVIKSGAPIIAKIIEVAPANIKYLKWDNLNGPTFTLEKSNVTLIKYVNGTRDQFTGADPISFMSDKDLFTLGKTDASKHYRKYRGAGTGTLIAGLASPVLGLIPAVITSSTAPKYSNLNYPNEELMRKADYYEGYTKKAKKIKQGKVWMNWGIAFGVNLIAAIVIVSGQ